MRWLLFLFPYCRWKNWGSELNYVPNGTQLISEGASMWIQTTLAQSLLVYTPYKLKKKIDQDRLLAGDQITTLIIGRFILKKLMYVSVSLISCVHLEGRNKIIYLWFPCRRVRQILAYDCRCKLFTSICPSGLPVSFFSQCPACLWKTISLSTFNLWNQDDSVSSFRVSTVTIAWSILTVHLNERCL